MVTETESPKTEVEKIISLNLWQKILNFFKKNSLNILLIASVVATVLFVVLQVQSWFSTTESDLMETIQQQQAQHVEDLQKLTNLYEEQQLSQKKLEKEFSDRLLTIEANYQEGIRTIQIKQRTTQKRLTENPDELVTEFREVFGIPDTND